MTEWLVFCIAMTPFICFTYVAIIECIDEYRGKND